MILKLKYISFFLLLTGLTANFNCYGQGEIGEPELGTIKLENYILSGLDAYMEIEEPPPILGLLCMTVEKLRQNGYIQDTAYYYSRINDSTIANTAIYYVSDWMQNIYPTTITRLSRQDETRSFNKTIYGTILYDSVTQVNAIKIPDCYPYKDSMSYYPSGNLKELFLYYLYHNVYYLHDYDVWDDIGHQIIDVHYNWNNDIRSTAYMFMREYADSSQIKTFTSLEMDETDTIWKNRSRYRIINDSLLKRTNYIKDIGLNDTSWSLRQNCYYTYDSNGYLITKYYFNQYNQLTKIDSFGYDSVGKKIELFSDNFQSVFYYYKYEYDSSGKLIRESRNEILNDSSPPFPICIFEYDYDKWGNVIFYKLAFISEDSIITSMHIDEFKFDNKLMLYYKSTNWSSSYISTYSFITYKYDQHNLMTERKVYSRSDSLDDWQMDDMYKIHWKKMCAPEDIRYSNISVSACDTFNSPTGKKWYIDGIYYDTVTSSLGCDSIIMFDLTLLPLDTGIFVKENYLSSKDSNAYYQWLDCENSYIIISGENNQDFYPVLNGYYAVKLTRGGCIDTSACYEVNILNIENNDFKTSLVISPNPTRGMINIELGQSHKDVVMTVKNALGQVLYVKNYGVTNEISYEIAEPQGFYIITIRTGEDKSATLRVIKN